MYLRDGSAQTNFTCCHTEAEVADQTFYLTQSQYTDTRPTSLSAYPIMPGAWQGSHWSANFVSHWYDSVRKNPIARDSNPGSSAPEADALTTRPTRRSAHARQPASLKLDWKTSNRATERVDKKSEADNKTHAYLLIEGEGRNQSFFRAKLYITKSSLTAVLIWKTDIHHLKLWHKQITIHDFNGLH